MRSEHHECDRRGRRPSKVVDESGDEPITSIYSTCSVCGVPQVFTSEGASNMKHKKLSVEVGTSVWRDVTYAVEQINGGARVHMTYAGREVGPIDLWHPVVVDSDERAEDVVRLWAVLLYDQEKKKK